MRVEQFIEHWKTHKVPLLIKELFKSEGYSLIEEVEQAGDDIILYVIIGGRQNGIVHPWLYVNDQMDYHWASIDLHYSMALNYFLESSPIPKDL